MESRERTSHEAAVGAGVRTLPGAHAPSSRAKRGMAACLACGVIGHAWRSTCSDSSGEWITVMARAR
jgi:hypothetical protein